MRCLTCLEQFESWHLQKLPAYVLRYFLLFVCFLDQQIPFVQLENFWTR